MASPHRTGRLRAVLPWAAFALACALNLYGIFAPSQPGPLLFPGADKVWHAVSFGLVMATGVVAGIRAVPLALALTVYAVASELVQHLLLPQRSGDVLDAAADVLGIGLGWLLARPTARWWHRERVTT